MENSGNDAKFFVPYKQMQQDFCGTTSDPLGTLGFDETPLPPSLSSQRYCFQYRSRSAYLAENHHYDQSPKNWTCEKDISLTLPKRLQQNYIISTRM